MSSEHFTCGSPTQPVLPLKLEWIAYIKCSERHTKSSRVACLPYSCGFLIRWSSSPWTLWECGRKDRVEISVWQVEENQFGLPKDRTSGAKDQQSQIDVLYLCLGTASVEEAQRKWTIGGNFFLYLKNKRQEVWSWDHVVNTHPRPVHSTAPCIFARCYRLKHTSIRQRICTLISS